MPMTDEDSRELSDAISKIVGIVARTEGPTITEKELVRLVINFANTGQPRGLPGTRVLEMGGQTFVLQSPEIDEQCAELKKNLAAIVRGELSGPAVNRLRKEASRMVLVPTHEPRNATTKFRHIPLDPAAVLAHTILLLRDQSKGTLGADLKRCQLPGCGIFFLSSDKVTDASRGGRKRERFCSDEHMDAAQTPGAVRTREWRKNKAKREAAKHK